MMMIKMLMMIISIVMIKKMMFVITIGQETFCPATFCPSTYIVPGQYVAFEVCFEDGHGCS